MGRGMGGYYAVTEDGRYADTKNYKVKDQGAIYVAEKYLDAKYRVVFRHEGDKQGVKTYDLVVKATDRDEILDRVEVKSLATEHPGQIAKEINKGFVKFNNGYSGTVELCLSGLSNNAFSRNLVQQGIDYANRKGYIKGPIRVWFSDNSNIIYSYNGREPLPLKNR
ncbi:MAG: hypothetical protein LUE27_08150 [Clostridia bacterium]|nr:hypothetical protein [Clostridia bacterium]